jgi:hypothetical protein
VPHRQGKFGCAPAAMKHRDIVAQPVQCCYEMWPDEAGTADDENSLGTPLQC